MASRNLLNNGMNELLIKVSYSEEFGTVSACKLDKFLRAAQSVRHQFLCPQAIARSILKHVGISCLFACMLWSVICGESCVVTLLQYRAIIHRKMYISL